MKPPLLTRLKNLDLLWAITIGFFAVSIVAILVQLVFLILSLDDKADSDPDCPSRVQHIGKNVVILPGCS